MTAQNRHQAGAPASQGGQFAKNEHGDAPGVLSSTTVDEALAIASKRRAITGTWTIPFGRAYGSDYLLVGRTSDGDRVHARMVVEHTTHDEPVTVISRAVYPKGAKRADPGSTVRFDQITDFAPGFSPESARALNNIPSGRASGEDHAVSALTVFSAAKEAS